MSLSLVDNNMTSEEFNKKHHENYDWHTSFDTAIGVIFFLVTFFLMVSLNKLGHSKIKGVFKIFSVVGFCLNYEISCMVLGKIEINLVKTG